MTANCLKILMWYDGPWLEYYEMDGKKYITKRHDDLLDGVVYDYKTAVPEGKKLDERWLVIELTDETDGSYFGRTMSLREVMALSPALYYGPYSPLNEGLSGLTLVNYADIDPEYLPSKDSFHNETHVYDPS